MADDPTSSDSPELPSVKPVLDERPAPVVNGSSPVTPPRRKVYESTLIPERRRRRVSPLISIPALLILFAALIYALVIFPRRVRFVPTVGKIVYASDQGSPGVPHLWISEMDGSGARQLTTGSESDSSPAFSQDGSKIAFLSTRGGTNGKKENQIFTMDADGQNIRQVTRYAGDKSSPAFAPSDQNLIGFTVGGTFSVADAQTGDTDRLLPPAADAHGPNGQESADTDAPNSSSSPTTVQSFSWTPARSRSEQGMAAVEENNGAQALAILPKLSGKVRNRQDDASDSAPLATAQALSVGWSPGEGGLLAVALLNAPGPGGKLVSAIVLLDALGNSLGQQPLVLTDGGRMGPQNPVFSPDGTQILFEVWDQPSLSRSRRLGLGLASLDGSAPRRIFKEPAESARFTRDGSHILFLHRRPGGGRDLCSLGADGAGFRRLSDGRADVGSLAVSLQSPAK